MEDEEQRTSFRNLSIHRANNEEEALNLVRHTYLFKAIFDVNVASVLSPVC